MATNDIRIGTIQRPLGRTMIPSTYIEGSSKLGTAKQPPFLLAIFRKRWYLWLFILPLMGAAGYGMAIYYGSHSTKVSTTLLYKPLLLSSGQEIYKPLDILTSEVLITSPENLNRITKLHGLTIPPSVFEKMIEIKTSPHARVLELSFSWSEANEAISILNDINEGFIEQVDHQRRITMQQYVPEIERNLLAASRKVIDINDKLQIARDEKTVSQSEKHLVGTADVVAMENAMDQAEATKQIIEAEIAGYDDAKKSIMNAAVKQLLEISDNAFAKTLSRYAQNHPDRKKILEAKNQVKMKIEAGDDIPSLSVLLDDVYVISKQWVDPDDLKDFSRILSYDSRFSEIAERQHSSEFALSTKTREIERIQRRISTKQDEITKNKKQLDDQAIAASKSADRISQFEAELEEANLARQEVQRQLDSLRQLESTQVHEYTVLTPPSLETAMTTSNKKKLFVGGFFLAGLLLIPPVLLVEWMARRETPLEEAARVFSLSVLGKNIAGDAIGNALARGEEQDSVRMLSLRIQQSLGGAESATVLFSSLDRSNPSAKLVAEIGKCLAQREERVLILDASGSSIAHEQLTKSLYESQRTLLLTSNNEFAGTSSTTISTDTKCGLAEYLTQETLEMRDLLQTTPDPQIDYLCGGDQPLPKEGFATRRLTNLFLDCRKEYSTILVLGPEAHRNADLQMLAARADGIIFTVGNQPQRNKAGFEALQELLELDAPVLGVVG